jgi:hypothetical protein
MTAKVLELNLSTNHFAAAARATKTSASSYGRSDPLPDRGTNTIRRPTRGIVLKEDTFATLRVVAGSGKPINIVDAGSRRRGSAGYLEINGKRATDVYSNFLLQTVLEERQEKQQILETFGEPYIFLFGERARIMNFQGILANTWDFNWETEWWYNYENFLRGSKCVQNDAQVFLSYDNTIVGGYIIQANAAKNSQERNYVNFQFSMFVTSYASIIPPGDPSGSQYPPEAIARAGTLDALKRNLDKALPGSAGEIVLYRQATPAQPLPTKDGTLAELLGAPTGLASLKHAWEVAQSQVSKLLSTVNGIYSGAPVRIPVGFEGSFAYDDEVTEAIPLVDQRNYAAGVVRYGTFAQNDDEYVGSGDQYSSSMLNLGAMNYQSTAQKLLAEEDIKAKAKRLLTEAGYTTPTEVIDKLALIARTFRFGMTVLNVTRAIANYTPVDYVPLVDGSIQRDVSFDTTGAIVDPSARLTAVYQG